MAKKRTRKDKVRAAAHQPVVRQVESTAPLSSTVLPTIQSQHSTSPDAHAEFAEILGFEPKLLWLDFGRTGIVFGIVMVILIGVSWWLR